MAGLVVTPANTPEAHTSAMRSRSAESMYRATVLSPGVPCLGVRCRGVSRTGTSGQAGRTGHALECPRGPPAQLRVAVGGRPVLQRRGERPDLLRVLVARDLDPLGAAVPFH